MILSKYDSSVDGLCIIQFFFLRRVRADDVVASIKTREDLDVMKNNILEAYANFT
jgi:hypothetical protein